MTRFARTTRLLALLATGGLLSVTAAGCAGILQREIETLFAFEGLVGTPALYNSYWLRLLEMLR